MQAQLRSATLQLVILALVVLLPATTSRQVHSQSGYTTIRVSVASDGTEGNNTSCCPALSADGRYVAFQSWASNLVRGDTNKTFDIFVRDLEAQQTKRVSVASDGTQANGPSSGHSISADGRYVAFGSQASNLVNDDTNGQSDIFVHDRGTGETTRVSVSSEGAEVDDLSIYPDISGDGRFVTFYSPATNLVPEDPERVCPAISDPNAKCADVFVHDRQTGETTRVSVASDGTEGNDHSIRPAISADGRFVAFVSWATNLVSDDTSDWIWDIFVHDRQTGETTRVSVASDGTEADGPSDRPAISADGRYVAFSSEAGNLVPRDTNNSCTDWTEGPSCPDVFVHDRATGETTLVSVASDGTQGNGPSNSNYLPPAISRDGQYVTFWSTATNLVPGDTNNLCDGNANCIDVFLHNQQTGETRRVSVAADGTEANNDSLTSSISGDGRVVAFNSYADNLVPGDSNRTDDVFVRARLPLVVATATVSVTATPTASAMATNPSATTTPASTATPTARPTTTVTHTATRQATATTSSSATRGPQEHWLYLPLIPRS